MNTPPVGFTPFKTIQPPIVQQGDSVQVNMTLTIPEAILVAFAKGRFQYHLDQDSELIYLGASQRQQDDFNTFVATKFSAANLTPEQQRLPALIESLWSKTQTTVDNELRIIANQVNSNYESNLRQQAAGQL